MALYKTIITNVVHDCMCWCLDEIFFLLIIILHYNCASIQSWREEFWLSPNESVSIHNTGSDAAENSFDFPVTSKHSSGNSSTRCEAVMLFGSLDRLPWYCAYP